MSDKIRPAGERTTVPPFRESVPAPSGIRAQVDTQGLERLLALALDMPVEGGSASAARFAADWLQQMLPSLAIGVRVDEPELGEPIVETRLSPGMPPPRPGDANRLFADLAAERVLPFGESLPGSALHLGSDHPESVDVRAPDVQFALRAIPVLETGLRRAQAFGRMAHQSAEVRRLQAQVIQTEKLASMGQIVAGVVHELNNPLTSIIAYSEYLTKSLERGDEPEDQLERVQRIGEAAERILRFSRDLVAYARPASDIPGAVWVDEVIDRALAFCEHEFTRVSVSVQRQLVPGLPPVRGIRGQLTQVFVNLFTNAAHAMSDAGGTLLLTSSTADDPSWVRIVVSDEGAGIASEHIDQIFEPFFTTKQEGRGTGLGLSIVRDIVQAHGGTLSVDSRPGAGTSFELVLPAAAKPSSRPP